MNTSTLLNNRYQITETIGKGGFSETFLAVDTHLPSGKQCVIKQLKPIIQEPTLPQWMCDRFDQEARILEDLGENHPQIPRLYAYFQEDKNFYLVQEWIEGNTLTQLVSNQGIFSEEKVEKFLQDLLPVIEFIHDRKIIHRDIKPDNIIYHTTNNLPVLIDFGIVKETLTTSFNGQGNSAYSIAIGTPGYMAGEQAAGRPIYSSDLYSLALTCVYLLTGKPPQSLQTDSRSGEFLWRQELPNLHSNLAGVIDRAICYNPRERFASASEMLSALNVSNHSYTNQPTIPVGGKNSPTIKASSESETYQPTLAVNPSTTQNVTRRKDKNNWFLTFLPLISLSLVAIASFVVGYNLLVNQEPTSQLDDSPSWVEEEENSPTENNPNIDDEDNNTEIEEPINEDEEITENYPISTPEPEIPLENEKKTELEEKPAKKQPPRETPPEISIPPKIKPLPQIPIAPIGTSATDLIAQFGSPEGKTQGSLDDTTKWSYRDQSDNITVTNYIIKDSNTNVQEVELLLPADSSLDFLLATVTQLTGNQVDLIVREALREVVEGKRRSRSFYIDGFRGTLIVKNSQIYLNIRENN